MYHKKNVDYDYLLWEEDLVYQVETKNAKRGNEMYYPCFTKVIVNFLMTKDQSIPRRNKVNWHFARDDHMFTTIKVVSRHEDTQLYGAILPNELTNEAIIDSESYKEYDAIALGAEPLKTKASIKKRQVESNKTKTPPTAKGKRLKTSAKAAKPAKKKQPAKTSKAKGLTVLSEVALTEAEQMKLATKRSLIETHSSHASGSGADEGTGSKPGVPDVPTYGSDDEQISWNSSDEEDVDEIAKNDDDDDNDDDNNNDDDDDEADNQDDNGQEYDVQDDDESAQVEEPMKTAKDLEEPAHQEFKTGVTEDQPDEETSQLPDWFQKPAKPPTPNRDWNKNLPNAHGPVQPWLSSLAQREDPRKSLNELMDTPLDFSAFVMNRLKVDTLTPELLAGPTFKLMKGSCKSLVELEYFFEEVYKATTDQLDWNNSKGQQYPYDLRKPLPLISNSRGRHVIPFDHFINNDLLYLSGGVSSRTYTTSVTKTKATNYRNIKWIEELVPNTMWSQVPHLDWITVRRDVDKLYTFKEGNFNRLCIQDIKDMLLLLVQGKLANLTVEERLAFNVFLRMFTRSVVIQRRMEDLQLGGDSVEYLPQTIWRQSDRDKAGAMIQAIDKQLKTRRIMQSLEEHLLVGMDRLRETLDCCNDHIIYSDDVLIITAQTCDKSSKSKNFKEVFVTFCHSDTERLSRSDEVLKLKNFKKDATLKLFKLTNQERYEHVGPEVTSSQDGNDYKMAKRDYTWLMISRCSRSHSRQDKRTSSSLKSMITTSNHKLMIEVKRAQD
ncbi:hypothetical protein Tco_0835365 [Tanacetum coccineum]